MENEITQNEIDLVMLKCLKEAYFRRAKAENSQKSVMLTREIDIIEAVIKLLKKSIENEGE